MSGNEALKELACTGNPLTSLDVSGNEMLEVLNCGSTQIASLDLSGNEQLRVLICYDTPLTSLDVSHCPYIARYVNEACYDEEIGAYMDEDDEYVLECDNDVELIVGDAWQLTGEMWLPEDLTRIEDEAFRGSSAIDYCLGENVSYIGAYAFADLTEEAWIYMPDHVDFIHDTAFSGSSVTLVCTNGSDTWNWAEAHGIEVSEE